MSFFWEIFKRQSFPTLVQFDNEISKDLRPRLERTGDQNLLQPFLDYFRGKSFQNGTSLLALWEGETLLLTASRKLHPVREVFQVR